MIKIVSPDPVLVTVAGIDYLVKVGQTLDAHAKPEAWYIVAFDQDDPVVNVPLSQAFSSRAEADAGLREGFEPLANYSRVTLIVSTLLGNGLADEIV